MAGFTLVIPWTDRFEKGLRGVTEVHEADPPEDASVNTLMKILNHKFHAKSKDGSSRIVECMLLYGVELSPNRSLGALIPELNGSSPRLIAQTRFVSNVVEIKIKTLTGKTIDLSFPVKFTVEELKGEIEYHEGIPPDQQRLIFDGMQLEDKNSLGDYGVKTGCTIHLVLRLIGGGPPVDFADLYYEDEWIVELQLDEKAPNWRVCNRGLNVEGECKNKECRAFGEMVIHPNGFNAFNLTSNTDVKCPLCKQEFTPITCGFYECVWKFDGKRSQDEFSISSMWKNSSGEKYHRFDTDEAGSSVKWDSLLIVAKSHRVAIAAKIPAIVKSAVVQKGNVCSICWSPFVLVGAKSVTTADCGHSFRRSCIGIWSDWCNVHDTMSSCPLCHKRT